MLLKEYFELVNYQITEGSTFMWSCFGPDARIIDSWNGDNDGWSADVVFDCQTSTVYQLNVCDYANNRAYRWIHPQWRTSYQNEATARQIDPDEAWDGVSYTQLEFATEFFEKAREIIMGEPPDTRVPIEFILEERTVYKLMLMAHKKDTTLNKLIQEIMVEYLGEHGVQLN